MSDDGIVTLERMEEVLEGGRMPVLVNTEFGIGFFGVEPTANSKLKSEDSLLRTWSIVTAVEQAAQIQEREHGG